MEIFSIVFLSEVQNLVVVYVKQGAELSTLHCLFKRDLLFESVEDGLPIVLIEATEVDGDLELDDGSNDVEETVHTFALASGLLGIEGITILQLDYVAVSLPAAPLEDHEIWLR